MEQISFPGCFVCGPDNACGLKAVFRTLDSGEVEGAFVADRAHCGYQGIVHGGIIMGFLDETLGRLAFVRDRLFLTHTLEVSFRKAAPPDVVLTAVARLGEWSRRQFTASGEIKDPDGQVIATATGRFLVMSEAMEDKVLGKNTNERSQEPGVRSKE